MTKSFQRTGKLRLTRATAVICSLAAVGVWLFPAASRAQETQVPTATSVLNPDPASALNTPAVALSAEEREAMITRKRQIRESVAEATSNDPPSPAASSEITGKGSELVGDNASQFPSPPGSIIIRRNNQNPPTLSQSSLAEPSAANNGAHVFAVGNFTHQEFSVNGGATWTKSNFPGGPADAPLDCCDNDVIHDRGRGVTFVSTLYINSNQTNGVVRIFVHRNINTAANCSYTIDPGGANNNILPDYPHIGKSNNHLYLTLNNIIGGTSSQAQVWRFNIDQMADCVGTTTNVANLPSSVGQRVVTPADGAQETQYFSWAENATQIRIFLWPQANAAPFSVLRATASSNFTNPDCRGGTLNNDFTGSLWSSIHGFNRRGAVGHGRVYFYWNVGPDTSHTQGHVHSVIFNELGLTLVGQPPMFISGNTQCNGIPGISTNDRGDLGITTAIGGRAGGGGTAARGFVGISDDFAGTIGFFPSLVLTANGTHNRTDGRYGDYFGIHRHNPCGNSWSAMNYALNGGNAPSSVNSRYVEFARGRDVGCNNEYLNAAPAAQ